MRIDNSRANLFRTCPQKYNWRYNNNLEKAWGVEGTAASPYGFGSRIHELLENHFKALGGLPLVDYPPAEEPVESECQEMLAAYSAHYPVELFSVVAVEQTFCIPIAGTQHSYTGKFDGIIRYPNGQIAILEHKSEKRSALKNLPEAWAAKSQVSLYMWAANELYGMWPSHILLDVLRRQSDKGQEPCTFYRDTLERTVPQANEAVADLVYVANQIERLGKRDSEKAWPKSTEACVTGRWKCDYYDLCVTGSTPELVQIKYKQAKEYLTL